MFLTSIITYLVISYTYKLIMYLLIVLTCMYEVVCNTTQS
ncbi:hypothetical protein EMIT0210MI2_11337 [Priestia megaterium]